MADIDANIDVVLTNADVIVEVSGSPGPAGPSRVSADADNAATLGSDGYIYVPESAAADEVLVLTVGAPVPPGTPAGTLIVRI